MEAWNGSRSDGASLDDDERQQDLTEPEARVSPQEAVDDAALDEEMTHVDSEGSDKEAEDAASEKPGFYTIESLNCAVTRIQPPGLAPHHQATTVSIKEPEAPR